MNFVKIISQESIAKLRERISVFLVISLITITGFKANTKELNSLISPKISQTVSFIQRLSYNFFVLNAIDLFA